MAYWDTEEQDFSVLVGQIITAIHQDGNQKLMFITDTARYEMTHHQDCCENVEISEIIGELSDLVNDGPVLLAEAVENNGGDPAPEYPDSWTWTFYKIRTQNGDVTIRWLGESNGYYSESVDFRKVKK